MTKNNAQTLPKQHQGKGCLQKKKSSHFVFWRQFANRRPPFCLQNLKNERYSFDFLF